MLEYVQFFSTKSLTVFLTFFTANQIHNPFPSPHAGFKLNDFLSNEGPVKQRVLGLDGENVLAHKPNLKRQLNRQVELQLEYDPPGGVDHDHEVGDPYELPPNTPPPDAPPPNEPHIPPVKPDTPPPNTPPPDAPPPDEPHIPPDESHIPPNEPLHPVFDIDRLEEAAILPKQKDAITFIKLLRGASLDDGVAKLDDAALSQLRNPYQTRLEINSSAVRHGITSYFALEHSAINAYETI
ncbi:hypothetical protein DFJ58DRAFT_734277 [Suillus subalutaceus]|uniref:uncharacterized protein n=1 Tax=Suillus subalutaceus TaxID=48586 RepID=UPI001B87BCFC|nr:uncharacterized protein DFJ58DRAFT_734277 [Suillus subalutaceus]KAG1837560.1 hypothetical protein DFJ58DRAFT_734277 [Suillus subalutaceus]